MSFLHGVHCSVPCRCTLLTVLVFSSLISELHLSHCMECFAYHKLPFTLSPCYCVTSGIIFSRYFNSRTFSTTTLLSSLPFLNIHLHILSQHEKVSIKRKGNKLRDCKSVFTIYLRQRICLRNVSAMNRFPEI